MSFWTVDLTTRDGAENAASAGGLTCFIVAGLAALGTLIGVVTSGLTANVLAGAFVEIAVFVMAGFRLRRGLGAFLGSAAVFFLSIEVLFRIVGFVMVLMGVGGSIAGIAGTVIQLVLLVPLINGMRGAWALRRGNFDEDVAHVFS